MGFGKVLKIYYIYFVILLRVFGNRLFLSEVFNRWFFVSVILDVVDVKGCELEEFNLV